MSGRQIGLVFDLNKCMGCHTCTVACKVLWTSRPGMERMYWMMVNTMPGKGYPKDWATMGGGYSDSGKLVLGHLPQTEDYGGPWEFNFQEVFFGGDGAGYLHPVSNPRWGPNWDEDVGGGEYPNSYFFYLPRLCNECSSPPCAEACPASAISKTDEYGIVLIDENRCVAGMKCAHECMRACPYKVIDINPVRNVAQMCNLCLPRLKRGIAPACVRQCPGRAVWIDFMDNSEGAVSKLVKDWKAAVPLHPEFRTQPNVFYVPPLLPPRLGSNGEQDISQPRIPTGYLISSFGQGVETALDTLGDEMARRRKGEQSDLLTTLIARRWHELLGPFKGDPSEVK